MDHSTPAAIVETITLKHVIISSQSMLSSHLYNFRHLSDLKVPSVNSLYHGTESVTHLQLKICDIAPKEFTQKTLIAVQRIFKKFGCLKTILADIARLICVALASLNATIVLLSNIKPVISVVFYYFFVLFLILYDFNILVCSTCVFIDMNQRYHVSYILVFEYYVTLAMLTENVCVITHCQR